MFGGEDDAAAEWEKIAAADHDLPRHCGGAELADREHHLPGSRPRRGRCPKCCPPRSARSTASSPHVQALEGIHRPESWEQKGAAEKRLRFDEAFVTQTVLAQRRAALLATDARPRAGRDGGLLDRFDARLPFELTAGQQEVGRSRARRPRRRPPDAPAAAGRGRLRQDGRRAARDAARGRLGWPGSAAGADRGAGAAAPPLDHRDARRPRARAACSAAPRTRTQVALLTGSLGAAARREALLDAASGSAGIVIGTHALLEEKVQFADLGLVVVDEQHRFGVEQRAALAAKSDTAPPHVLVMTATPIPRTVAMTVFGDLETSTLARAACRPRGECRPTSCRSRSSRPGSSAPTSASARRSARATRSTSSARGSATRPERRHRAGRHRRLAVDGGRRGDGAAARRGRAARPASGDAARADARRARRTR